jgi:two-component system, LytTR family, response regulator
MEQSSIKANSKWALGSSFHLVLVSAAIVFGAYTSTVYVANSLPIVAALIVGAANTAPVILFGTAAFFMVRDRLRGLRRTATMIAHAALCVGFSFLSYWLLVVLLGLIHGASATEFSVHSFTNRNMAWQLLENATVYGLIAAVAIIWRRPRALAMFIEKGPAENGRTPARYFVRIGDEIRAIDTDSIVSISGADDYSEIATTAGRHLVRMTLAEFERSLDPARFIRVHRCRIVNVERIERAEPAGGGRLLLHMEDGEMIGGSRTGSRLLRHRVI